MAGATLSIRKPTPPGPDPLAMPDPVFDHAAHYGEVGGIQGVKYVQGDNFFKPNYDFHSVAPAEARLKPLTKEQEADRQKRMSATRKMLGKKLAQSAEAVPQKIIDAERENARAKAAESLSE